MGSALKLEVVKYPDPFLRKRAEEVSEIDDELLELIEAMFRILPEDKGIGLAAPQVRVSKRLFLINLSADPVEHPELNQVFINPVIEPVGDEKDWDSEGCLSFPDIRINVERYKRVRIRAYDEKGMEVDLDTGEDFWLARVLQHEYDHLDGRLITDRSNPVNLLAVEGQLKELERVFECAVKIRRSKKQGEAK